jgi:hypothetical protein
MAQIASMEAVVAARVPSAAVASTSASTSRHAVVAGACQVFVRRGERLLASEWWRFSEWWRLCDLTWFGVYDKFGWLYELLEDFLNLFFLACGELSDVCGSVVGAGASLRGQNVYSLRGLASAGVSSRSLSLGGKKAKLESTQQRRVPSVTATIAAPGMWCMKFTE